MSPASLPPPVGPGSRVGVAALSGPVDPGRLQAGLAALERLGLVPVPAANLGSDTGLFAGGDAERLAAFHRLASDPSLDAILFARGGHGVLRLLPALDWPLLARRPRAYVGYSDVTPFLLQVVQRLGLAAFHGPMVAADLARGLTAEEEGSFLDALAGRPQTLPVVGRAGDRVAEGPLLGGCLSLLAALPGTAWAPDLDGAIFFWEEVAEPLYRIDRMLTQLELSGWLERIAGMVVGQVTAPPHDAEEEERLALQLDGVLDERSARHGWPLARGLPAGHAAPNRTLPLGTWARLNAATLRVELEAG